MLYEHQMQRFESIISAAADDAFKQLMSNPRARIYVWCIPSSDTAWGRLTICTDKPDGAELVSSTPVSASLTRDQVRHWIRVRSDAADDEDRDFERAAQVIRQGWDRSKHTLHFPLEHARLVLDAVNSACNCLEDEIEHAQGDRELIAINKSLVAAALRMHATIVKSLNEKEDTHESQV